MRTALQELLGDFLSTIVFIAVFTTSGDALLATGVAVAVAIGQFIWFRATGRSLDMMHWLSLSLAVLLGTLTFLSHDNRFIMLKPSIGHGAVALAMLRPGWMARYLPDQARDHLNPRLVRLSGYAWALLLLALAAANALIASTGDMALWTLYVTVIMIAVKLIAGIVQYAVFRYALDRALARERKPAEPQPGPLPAASRG